MKPAPMPESKDRFWWHVYDVHHTKSVVDLWRRFEVLENDITGTSDSWDDASRMTRLTGDSAKTEEVEASECAPSTTGASKDQPQSLLAAFEAELAHVLSSTETETSENTTEQSRPSHDSGSPLNPQRLRPVVRDFVEKTLHYIHCQASGISSELEARLPGLRRQLSEAQRDLPESLRELLQGLFASLEHSVTTYGAVPRGRQLAEEVVQAGGPIAENAVVSLQALASEFEQVGRTLFSTFESEFGRSRSNATGPSTTEASGASAGTADAANLSCALLDSDSQATASNPTNFSSPKETHTTSCAGSGSHYGVRTLFIGNVGYKVTARMIFDVFHSNGFMLDVDLPLDTASGGHVGFGYLRFLSVSDANLAMQKMQGVHIDGHAINLEFSDTDHFSSVQPHSWHGTVDHASLDGSRGTRCASGVDYGMGAQHTADGRIAGQGLESASEHGEVEPLEERQLAALQHGSPSPDDLSTEKRTTAPEPLGRTGGRWENLHSEREMSRFPPVSQLEAQHLAGQWCIRAPAHPANPRPSEAISTNSVPREAFSTCQPSSASSTKGPSPQTERRSSQDIARNSTVMDTWARLDRRERGRLRPTPYRDASENHPGNASQPQIISAGTDAEQAKDAEIENCISSLVNMGFGSLEQGGRDRLGVYAIAAKGNVYDAVGMIEDEQKIYADLRLD